MAVENPRGRQVMAVSVAFTVWASCFVAMRLVARLILTRQGRLDDVLIIGSLMASITFTALVIAQEQLGLGRHFASLAPGEYETLLKPFWASVWIYNVSLTLTKISILLQFLRFFITPVSRRVCKILAIIILIYGFFAIFGSIFSCLPIDFFWDRSIIGGRCWDRVAFWFSNASFNILSDFCICLLPVPVLRDLKLPRKQKCSLIVVFAMGGFGCLTSILRLRSLYLITRSTDITYDNVGAATWSSIEMNTGIICACLPTVRPIINNLFPNFLHERSTSDFQRPHRPSINVSPDNSARTGISLIPGLGSPKVGGIFHSAAAEKSLTGCSTMRESYLLNNFKQASSNLSWEVSVGGTEADDSEEINKEYGGTGISASDISKDADVAKNQSRGRIWIETDFSIVHTAAEKDCVIDVVEKRC